MLRNTTYTFAFRPFIYCFLVLALLFVASAASTSAALIMLFAHRFRLTTPALADLRRMDDWMIALELVVLAALIVSLGPVATAWLNVWGLLLAVVVIVGNIAPLVLARRARLFRELNMATAAVLVLIGGLLLRIVIVYSAQAV